MDAQHLGAQAPEVKKRALNSGADTFVEKARAAHGDRYDYSKVVYVQVHEKVEIVCPTHGSFWQAPHGHRKGHGCPACKAQTTGDSKRFDQAEFLRRAIAAHAERYDYSRAKYTTSGNRVEIICSVHGVFKQLPSHHWDGRGCFRCASDVKAAARRYTNEEFIEVSRRAHGDKFDYRLVDYRNVDVAVTIICPKHGAFQQTPYSHMQGSGCNRCSSHGPSGAEDKLADYLSSRGVALRRSDRKIIRPFEIDMVAPERRLGIEFNGVYWHSDRVQKPDAAKRKYDLAEAAGFGLITAWEFDLRPPQRARILRGRIVEACGMVPDDAPAGVDSFGPIEPAAAKAFLLRYDLAVPQTFDAAFGAASMGVLSSVVTFLRRNDHEWMIRQIACTSGSLLCAVGLVRFGIHALSATTVWAVADRDHCFTVLYDRLDFLRHGFVEPDYQVWHDKIGLRAKSYWSADRMPSILSHLGVKRPMPDDISEIQDRLRAYRVYGPGKIIRKLTLSR